MCHQHQCCSSARIKPKEQIDDSLAGSGIQIARRLIREKDFGFADKGSGNGNPMLLPTR